MAIIYSYPLAEEVTNDSWVLGSEMENGLRVVKNYSVGDIASFIQQEYTTIPTLQQVTEEGANTNVQMQINGVDVATVNDITGTPTLQEVVAEGNTVSGGAYINVTNGSLSAWVMGGNVNVSNAVNTMDVFASGLLFQKQFGTGSVELKFPNTINDTRVIEFPNASGIIALTNDLVTPNLQQVTDEGATTTNTITINKAENEQALIITGDNAPNGLLQITAADGPCIKTVANDGSSVYASNVNGNAIVGVTEEGAGVVALATTVDGTALLVSGLARGLTVSNGGVYITGSEHDASNYQLALTANLAAKPSTNTWTITSDERVKTNINPYTKGLETILAINPVTYDYNGKAGFDPTNIGNIGVIAQDVLNIIPESINTYNALFNEDDEEKTELYNFDSHALTFILINAVKQLNAEIELLKTQLT